MISMCIYFYAHKWTLTFVLINRLQFKEKGVIVWWRIKAQCESQPLSTAALNPPYPQLVLPGTLV